MTDEEFSLWESSARASMKMAIHADAALMERRAARIEAAGQPFLIPEAQANAASAVARLRSQATTLRDRATEMIDSFIERHGARMRAL